MNFPVFDLHCDTSLTMLENKSTLRSNSGHIDLSRASQLPGYAQCFACFTTTDERAMENRSPVLMFERELAILLNQIEENAQQIHLAYTPEEVAENLELGYMSAILSIEGPAGFGFDPELLEDLHKIGFRMTTLGWNESNPLTGSHKTGEGLTDLGREYVRQAQRLGMIVDVSHISDKGFWDIMDITEKPVIASHSNSRAICNVSRNLSDDMFRQICATGGVAGFNMYREFVGTDAKLDTACKHILHFLEMDPDAKHISLGGDLDGCDVLVSGFEGVQDYPCFAAKLLEYGLTEAMVRNIFWNNALEVMKRCSM